ncbi:MAG: SUMF1/EgtB/PvdO family nonheme iron enzyme [Acidobacteriota bacterium]
MIRFKNLPVVKIIILFIALLLIQGDFTVYGIQSGPEVEFEKAKKEYIAGEYGKTEIILDKLLDNIKNEFKELRGKIYLLLGAVYEHQGNNDRAVINYLLGKMLLEKPVIEGVDLTNMPLFCENVLDESSERNVIEKKGIVKEKKKFPLLLTLGGVVIAGVLVYLFTKSIRSGSDTTDDRESKVAREIYDSIEWVDIPAGEFKMGDNFNEGEPDERPVHSVYLDGYKISRYEITFEQYDNYSNVSPARRVRYDNWGRGNRPVIYARYADAVSFCTWLSKRTGKNINLPTEAQWEKAARGTDQRRYPWGNDSPNCSLTNFQNCNGKTMPVGSFPDDISYYGVYDMGGNVSEWCSDWYSPDYYSVSPETNPAGPDQQPGGAKYVVRGGNWSTEDVRSADRSASISIVSMNNRTGFRIVMKN